MDGGWLLPVVRLSLTRTPPHPHPHPPLTPTPPPPLSPLMGSMLIGHLPAHAHKSRDHTCECVRVRAAAKDLSHGCFSPLLKPTPLKERQKSRKKGMRVSRHTCAVELNTTLAFIFLRSHP